MDSLKVRGTSTVTARTRNNSNDDQRPSRWYLVGDSCQYIERGSVDVCLQNSGHVHPFIIKVDYEVGEMLAIKEKSTRTFRRAYYNQV